MCKCLVILAALSSPCGGIAQEVAVDPPPARFLCGFDAVIAGETIDYHSAEPDVDRALLVRSIEARRSIAWRTESVPRDFAGDHVTFTWMFGMDASPETRAFQLLVDGVPQLTFHNPGDAAIRQWRVAGNNGTELRLRTTCIDKHADVFGYASLQLPVGLVRRGAPVRLELRGESAGSRIWCMTFLSRVRPRILVEPLPAILRAGREQAVQVGIVHMGEPTRAQITLPHGARHSLPLEFGWNSTTLGIAPTTSPRRIRVKVSIAGRDQVEEVTQTQVRPWQIDLVQHTHTDIGYTRPQTEILPEHLRFIDYALDYCDATDAEPDAARFRWTCEASWPVREYLRTRPAAQIDRLRRRVAEGRIEVTGMLFNMSELPGESLYADFVAPLRAFEQHGLAVTTAMQNDVHGAAWCLIDLLAGTGVKYLTMGPNSHRALIPFDKPTVFWWEAPSGKRLLAFRGEHYMTANQWGIHTGQVANMERGLFPYLASLAAKGYALDRIAIQYQGYVTDNSPPGLAGTRTIKAWNRKYLWPKLRNAVARDFLSFMAEKHGGDLPVFRTAWPDWWTDGCASAPREAAAVRRTQRELTATQGVAAIALALGSRLPADYARRVEHVTDALLFYGEHTYGAAESIREPTTINSVVQWSQKAAYAWTAVKQARLLRETAMGMLQAHLPASDVPTLCVVNTMNFRRSGLCRVYIEHEILPPSRTFRIVGAGGRQVVAQRQGGREDGSYWHLWVPEVPALGYRVFRIEVGAAAAVAAREAPTLPRLQNAFYRLVIDPKTGCVTSLFDKELGRELVDQKARWGLGQFIHETLDNRHQMELYRLDEFKRTALQVVAVTPGASGPVWHSFVVHGNSPCANESGVRYEIRLYQQSKRIEFHYRLDRPSITRPESAYVAFPFALAGAELSYEAQGGIAIPGKTLLPGTSADWQAVQGFARARTPDAQILLLSPDIPLMQFGGIHTGRFQPVSRVERPHLYSWVFNNYWTTNFCASQAGELRFAYALTSTADSSDATATSIGWSTQLPLLTRVLPPRPTSASTPMTKPGSATARSGLEVDAEHVLLVSAKPTPDGILLHLRECDGRPARCTIAGELFAADVLGRRGAAIESPLRLAPREVRFVYVVPAAQIAGK